MFWSRGDNSMQLLNLLQLHHDWQLLYYIKAASVAEYPFCFAEKEKTILTFIQQFYKVLVEQIY